MAVESVYEKHFSHDEGQDRAFSPINMQKYEVLDIVGKGAYGSVYKARSRQDNRTYVVKRVALKDAEATRELEILQRIRHPFIVAYKDTFEYDEHLCIVMTYCPGGDLYHFIKETAEKHQHFDEDLVMTWFMFLQRNFEKSSPLLIQVLSAAFGDALLAR